ncbi:MAG: FHA domain-containing protein [Verrucomicrobiota bacterium]
MPKLVVSGTGHELTEELITIGRAPDNLIVIDDPSVSGRHAEIRLVGDTYHLKDLGSTNGTRVNGIPTTETALRFDDRLRFGGVDARYESDTRGSQPLPDLEDIAVKPAESSAAPVDFANASPFPRRKHQKDPIRTAILSVAGIAVLAFLGSMVLVLMMQGPSL